MAYAMSVLGQKRTLKRLRTMSSLPPKADIGCALCEVCFVPKADVVAPGPLERRHRSKSLPLAVNEDAYEHRCEGEDDQKAAEYHSEPNTR